MGDLTGVFKNVATGVVSLVSDAPSMGEASYHEGGRGPPVAISGGPRRDSGGRVRAMGDATRRLPVPRCPCDRFVDHQGRIGESTYLDHSHSHAMQRLRPCNRRYLRVHVSTCT